MKKTLLCAVMFISAMAMAQHPTDKGWRSVGGTGRLYLDLDGSDGTAHSFTLAPETYWFVGNSFGLGADFGFGMAFSKVDVNDSITTRVQSFKAWLAPGFRYYVREPEKAWRPYFFGNAGYILNSYRQKTTGTNDLTGSSNGFRGYAGAGMAWFFSDHAAFDVRLKVIDYSVDQLYYNPDFTIGVQAFFD